MERKFCKLSNFKPLAIVGGFLFQKVLYIWKMISAILLCWLWTKFEPVKWLIESYTFKNRFVQFIWEHFTCPKCVGLWVGLVMTQDIFHAIIVSICTSILHKLT